MTHHPECEDEFDANDAAKLREALAKRGLKDRGGRMTEITQADHNAAEEHFDLWNPNTAWGYEPLVEAFARHRLAERAKIVAWLRGKPDGTLEEQLLGHAIKRGEHETFAHPDNV